MERETRCQYELEPSFNAIAEAAEAQGWTKDEVAFALLALSVARIKTIDANADTDEAIERAVASVGHHSA